MNPQNFYLIFFTNCLKLFSLIPATYLLSLFISQVVLLFIIERNIPLVLCIPCVLFIVKIKYLENIRVDQLYHKKFEGKDIDPSISVEVNMVMMLVKHIFFNLSGHLIPIDRIQGKCFTLVFKSADIIFRTSLNII